MEKTLTTKITILLLLSLTSHEVMALDWNELKSAALLSAPSLKSAKADLESSKSGVDSAKASFYPKVNSSLTASRAVDTDINKSSNSYAAALSLEQSLYASGRDQAQLSAAKASQNATAATLKANSVALRASLRKAWNNALYLNELAKITLRNINRRKSNYQIVSLRYSGGRENKGSVLRTEATTLQAKLTSEQAAARAILAKGDLSVIAGREISEGETLTGDLKGTEPVISKTSNQNPTITASELKLTAAEESLKSAKARYLPEVSLSAAARKSASPDLPLHDPVYSAGVTLTVPLFNPATSADVRSAAARTTSASVALAQAKATQDQKIKTAMSQYQFAVKNLEISKKSYEASKLQAEVSRQRYTLGLMSFQDWDSFENDFIRSELDVLQSEKDVADSLATYQEAIGMTLEEGP